MSTDNLPPAGPECHGYGCDRECLSMEQAAGAGWFIKLTSTLCPEHRPNDDDGKGPS